MTSSASLPADAVCEGCNHVFPSATLKARHDNSKLCGIGHMCSKCQVEFATAEGLKSHVRDSPSHRGEPGNIADQHAERKARDRAARSHSGGMSSRMSGQAAPSLGPAALVQSRKAQATKRNSVPNVPLQLIPDKGLDIQEGIEEADRRLGSGNTARRSQRTIDSHQQKAINNDPIPWKAVHLSQIPIEVYELNEGTGAVLCKPCSRWFGNWLNFQRHYKGSKLHISSVEGAGLAVSKTAQLVRPASPSGESDASCSSSRAAVGSSLLYPPSLSREEAGYRDVATPSSAAVPRTSLSRPPKNTDESHLVIPSFLPPTRNSQAHRISLGRAVMPNTQVQKRGHQAQGSGKASNVPQCPICLNHVADDTDLAATFCGHVFCSACIMAHLGRKSECPVCRKQLLPQMIIPIYF